MTIVIRTYQDRDSDGVASLWREAFPDDPPHNRAEVAIPAKLAVQPELFLVAVDSDDICGTAMAGYDGHRGWLYAVAVRQSRRRKAIGSKLIAEAETRLRALGCAKVNLQVRSGNEAAAEFYSDLGYATEERMSMGKRL